MSVEDKLYYSELFDEYRPLLTENKREIFDMYCRLDLSLGEIAEIKGVSRQGVSDCIAGVKAQLVSFEEKLGCFAKKKAILSELNALGNSAAGVKERIEKILGEY